jgi:hypothetical protein
MKIRTRSTTREIKEYFTETELNILGAALEKLAEYHEDKADIRNETGVSTNYIAQHKKAAYDVRELKISLEL